MAAAMTAARGISASNLLWSWAGRSDSRVRGRHERLDDDLENVVAPPVVEEPSSNSSTVAIETVLNPTPTVDNSPSTEVRVENTAPTADREEQSQHLLQLQTERDLRRSRQFTCTLIAIILLFLLWMQALLEQDFGLTLLCLMGTSWTVRWIQSRRDEEEELDNRMEHYLRSEADDEDASPEERAARARRRRAGFDFTTNHELNLNLMSFQAQLALAILESQRQMMENGGYGGSSNNGESIGVSETGRERWDRFTYSSLALDSTLEKKGVGGYGSVSAEESGRSKRPSLKVPLRVTSSLSRPDENMNYTIDNDLPTCSICLCEYEDGDAVAKLPCGHVYHYDCVSAWCQNHTRCPLCNFDLEEANGAGGDAGANLTDGGDSIV